MKVLVIGSRVPFPLHDGGAIATYNLLKGLAGTGIEVSFATLNTKKHFADDGIVQKEFSFVKRIVTHYINTDISLVDAFKNLFSSDSYNVERFYSRTFEETLLGLIREHHYDIIHFEGLFVAKYAHAIRRITHAKLLLRQHNIEFHIWKTLAGASSSLLKRTYLNLLASRMERFEKSILPVFDAIVAITDSDRKEMESMGYSGKLESIPAGIDIKAKLSTRIDYKSIYHIGSMEWLPNRQAMEWFRQDIWPLISSGDPEAAFFMGGKNMPEHYKNWGTDKFHVAGEIHDLETFTEDKSILVVPLKSGSGIRIKTIEAMLAGKAVVTTSQGALGLAVRHKEHCLIADSAEEFAQAVLTLLSDHEMRNKLADNGRQFASEHFGNEAVSRRWADFYTRLLG